MDKQVGCREMGVACDFVAHGKTEDEALQQLDEHARNVHHIEMTPDMKAKARDIIRGSSNK